MTVLRRKLLRDLRRLVGQVLTIALVVGAGIAAYLSSHSGWTTLQGAREAWYDRERFGDVFAALERAPLAVAARLEAIDGVRRVYPRVTAMVSVDLATQGQPPVGRLVSIPDEGPPPLNGVALSAGRWPAGDEAVLLTSFAQAWKVEVGDVLPVIQDGERRELRIVGLGDSPEYVFAVAPGNVAPELDRFAVLWVPHAWLAPRARMEGAFDDVVLSLSPGASRPLPRRRGAARQLPPRSRRCTGGLDRPRRRLARRGPDPRR